MVTEPWGAARTGDGIRALEALASGVRALVSAPTLDAALHDLAAAAAGALGARVAVARVRDGDQLIGSLELLRAARPFAPAGRLVARIAADQLAVAVRAFGATGADG